MPSGPPPLVATGNTVFAPLTSGQPSLYGGRIAPREETNDVASPVAETVGVDDRTLRLVAEQARTQAGCLAAGVTVVEQGAPALVVGTSLLGHQLEQVQWDLGQGPGMEAMRQLQVFNVACLATSRSWPDFVASALSRGVRSTLAVPVILRGRALGALDFYSDRPDGFEDAERVALHFAGEVAAALATLEPWAGLAPTGRGRPRPVRAAGSGRVAGGQRARAVS